MTTPIARVLSAGVVTYQWTLRPFIGAQCRHEPSCSHYALEALARHGAARGSLRTARRILRGDPVPPASPPIQNPHSPAPEGTMMDHRKAY